MNNNNVDKKLLRELFSIARREEGRNLRTGKNDDETMRKYIEQEIKKIVYKEGNH